MTIKQKEARIRKVLNTCKDSETWESVLTKVDKALE
jgi:hypothetical protein